MDKRLSLAEVAAIWKPTDSEGEPLTGTAAIEAVLKLVFVSLEGVRLQASYDFSAPIQAERFIWPDTGKGLWERFNLTGLVHLRFRRDHAATDDGCIWIDADDGLDGVPNVLVVLPDNPRQKVRVTCQCRMVAEDDFFIDSSVRIEEQRLIITEDSLRDYARTRGRGDVLKRLDTLTAGGAVAADDVVIAEYVKQGKEETEVLSVEHIKSRPRTERAALYGQYHGRRKEQGIAPELIAAELWSNDTGASYAMIDRIINGSRPGKDRSLPTKNGKELVQKGMELMKKNDQKKLNSTS